MCLLIQVSDGEVYNTLTLIHTHLLLPLVSMSYGSLQVLLAGHFSMTKNKTIFSPHVPYYTYNMCYTVIHIHYSTVSWMISLCCTHTLSVSAAQLGFNSQYNNIKWHWLANWLLIEYSSSGSTPVGQVQLQVEVTSYIAICRELSATISVLYHSFFKFTRYYTLGQPFGVFITYTQAKTNWLLH